MPSLSEGDISSRELRLRVLAALRELAREKGTRDGYFKPPKGLKAFARAVLADVDISASRVGWEIVDVMATDGWIERSPDKLSSQYWRIGAKAPVPGSETPREEQADTPNPAVTRLIEALESAVRLTARQAVKSGDLSNLLEILNDLQTRLDPQIMSRIQIRVMEEMQATVKPAEG